MVTQNSINSQDPIQVARGGTGRAALTSHGILIGNGTGAITQLAGATDGQIPIGSTGNDPVLATLTAGRAMVVSNSAGAIGITTPAFSAINVLQFTANGTYTPNSLMQYCIVEVVGAGGASGGATATSAGQVSCGSGGAGGAYAKVVFTSAQIGASRSVTVGSGGVANVGAAGNSGTASFFGTSGALINCGGGRGNANGASATAQTGAAGADGAVIITEFISA